MNTYQSRIDELPCLSITTAEGLGKSFEELTYLECIDMKLNIVLTAVALAGTSLPSFSAGPTGWGALKIGLSREALSSLQVNDGVYLSEPLQVAQSLLPFSVQGVEEVYVGRVNTPFGGSGIATYFRFADDRLVGIEFSLDDRPELLTEISSQIRTKYGESLNKSDKKPMHCRLPNGSSMPILSGSNFQEWTEQIRDGGIIATRIYDISIGCPGDQIVVRHKGFSIKLDNPKIEKKIDNKF